MPGFHRRRPPPEFQTPTCPTCRVNFDLEERHCQSPTCDIWICEDDDTVFEVGRDLVRPTRPKH